MRLSGARTGPRLLGRSWARRLLARAALLSAAFALVGCTNSPYPEADSGKKVLYIPYLEAPRKLDPQVTYSTVDHAIVGRLYDTLLEYHYLERPYRVIPGMLESVPEPELLPDGKVRYSLHLRDGLSYTVDDCFRVRGASADVRVQGKRPVVAADILFALERIADPKVASDVGGAFAVVEGFDEFRVRLVERRKEQPGFAELPVSKQYAEVGGISGVSVTSAQDATITLGEVYPQFRYWMAMNFLSPVAFEAVEHYDGKGGRDDFAEHPVATGPYRMVSYEKHARIVLEKNPDWYGVTHPEQKAPGATFPDSDDPKLKRRSGQPLPLVERVELRMEKERIPSFGKFLQGYYDMSTIAKESFDKVVLQDRISPEMQARGVGLEKTVAPGVYYIGFNLDDPVIGRAGGERARAIRQALSLATDVREFLRLFMNGRGVVAQQPIPPGLFGHDASYRNPYRQPNLEKARALLASAGLPGGVDPKTGKPLVLTFDVPDTAPEELLRFRFWVDQWRRLGIDVKLEATTYNAFQEKVRKGSYQIFQWGWIADYPDPENFLFLLTTPMARSVSQGPNTANFKDAEYDRLFSAMRTRDDDAERARVIGEMRAILERERPWIELFHPEDYVLVQGWTKDVVPFGMSVPMTKYYDIDPETRRARREAWNAPVLWPAYVLVLLLAALVIPAVVTFRRERQ